MICEYYAPPEKDTTRLKWGMDFERGRNTTGRMEIKMSAFFPCSQENLKKLLKITDMDWEHGAGVRGQIIGHLTDRIAFCTAESNRIKAEVNRMPNPRPKEFNRAAKEVKTLTGQIARFEKLKDITQQWRDRRGDDLWQQ